MFTVRVCVLMKTAFVDDISYNKIDKMTQTCNNLDQLVSLHCPVIFAMYSCLKILSEK